MSKERNANRFDPDLQMFCKDKPNELNETVANYYKWLIKNRGFGADDMIEAPTLVDQMHQEVEE